MKKLITTAAIAVLTAAALAAAVSREEAEQIALDAFGIDRGEALAIHSERERDWDEDGWEVDITANGRRWSGFVNSDGTVWQSRETTTATVENPTPATKDSALETALADAGTSRDYASRISSKRDSDDGRVIYEVDFRADGYDYEYDIDGATSAILKVNVEKNGRLSASQGSPKSQAEAEAKALSLLPAGYSVRNVWQDRDDGRLTYSISASSDTERAEIELEATTLELKELSRENTTLRGWDD